MLDLKRNLRLPSEFDKLFDGIEKANDLATLLKNKDYFVKSKIDTCNPCLNKIEMEQLIHERFISGQEGKIIVKKSFTLHCSCQGFGVTINGPVSLERGVAIGRSIITGPAYISEESEIYDSHLRGTPDGAVYIGKNCHIWDFSEINRSLVGDSSMIHTCNINDSIVGPQSNFGAAHIISVSGERRNHESQCRNQTLLGQRIVIANYSSGNKIRILDPTTDEVLQIEASHFGAICGTGVSCGSGTIIYPGTIVGAGARINTTVPITGYIKSNQICSLFLIIRQKKNGKTIVQLKGTLAQSIRESFDISSS